MDMILCLIISIALSLYKIAKSGESLLDSTVQVVESSINDEGVSIPIGNNLMLKRDKHAFKFILYQLGVVKR